jgi:hypothetical protein
MLVVFQEAVYRNQWPWWNNADSDTVLEFEGQAVYGVKPAHTAAAQIINKTQKVARS